MPFYIVLAISTFLLSLLGTRLVILAARARPIPINPRRAHERPIPRGGGFAVVMALVIGLMMADVNYAIVLSVFLIAAVSLLGDLIPVLTIARLLVYMLAVLLSVSVFKEPVFGGILPFWADKTITILLWTWFIHIFTRMDGIDGNAPTQMVSISMGFLFLTVLNGSFSGPLSIYSLVIMTAGGGFLWWNWYPAKIHFGAVGCAPAGYLIGYSSGIRIV